MHQGSGPSTLLGEGERGILTGGAHGFYQPFLEIVVGGEVGALEVVGNRVDLVEQVGKRLGELRLHRMQRLPLPGIRTQCGDGCNFQFSQSF